MVDPTLWKIIVEVYLHILGLDNRHKSDLLHAQGPKSQYTLNRRLLVQKCRSGCCEEEINILLSWESNPWRPICRYADCVSHVHPYRTTKIVSGSSILWRHDISDEPLMHTASCFHIRGRTLLSVNQINGIIFLNKAILKLSRYLECHLNFVNALLNTTTAIFHKKQREKERVCVCVS